MLTAVFMLAPPEPVLLRFRPELTTTYSHQVRMEFTDSADGSQFTTEEKIESFVRQRSSRSEIVTEHKVQPIMTWMDGKEVAPPAGSKPSIFQETRIANGIMTLRSEDPFDNRNAMRYSIMTTVMFKDKPVQVGERWRFNIESIPELGTPRAFASFRLMELRPESKPTAAVVEMHFEEGSDKRPMIADGTAEIDLKTGITTNLELKVQDAPIPGGEEEPMSLRLTWRLLSMKIGNPFSKSIKKPS